MEGLVRLVAESLARHGMELAPPRVEWSDWKQLESSLCLTAPSHPGLYSVAERIASHSIPSEIPAIPHFAIFHEGHTQDLGFEMGRLCSPYSLLRDRIAKGDCWVRYAVTLESAFAQGRKPIAHSLEFAESSPPLADSPCETEIPMPLPSGF